MIDIIKLYHDHNIDFKTEGNKHCTKGWVNINCPLCNGDSFHLGYCVDSTSKFAGSFVCWRCGGHSTFKVLRQVLKHGLDIKEIIKRYRVSGYAGPSIQTEIRLIKSTFKYPTDTGPLQNHHRKYLVKRNFNPDYIEQEWGVLGTGPLSTLSYRVGKEKKVLDYRNRLIIPIKWNGKIVSFQGRAITERSKMKYLACPEEREVINLKTIIYGKTDWKRCVVVEGVTDVWRLGFGAVSLFGIKYTLQQIRVLSKFEEVFLLFDPESQAQAQAKKIQAALNFRGVKVELLDFLETDPGDMKQDDADHLMSELKF